MEAELLEIYNFLAKYPPFNELPEETLIKVTENIEISYYRQDTPIIHLGDQIDDLYMVRSGVVEVYRRKGELYNRSMKVIFSVKWAFLLTTKFAFQ